MEIETDERVLDLIEAGVMAGRYWAAIREDRYLEAGYTRLALRHRTVGADLCSKISTGAGRDAAASVAMPRAGR
jgi:hypothetical protein